MGEENHADYLRAIHDPATVTAMAIWEPWAPDLRGARIESGHHMAEEAPEALAGELRRFLAEA